MNRIIYSLLITGLLCNCASSETKKTNPNDDQATFTLNCSNAKDLFYNADGGMPTTISITRFLDHSPTMQAHSLLMKKDSSLWAKAVTEYNNKNYAAAKTTMQPLLVKYGDDLILRELYARSWYWSTGHRKNEDKLLSFYLDLQSRIQNEIRIQDGVGGPQEVHIVSGFTDVEWKISTIYLDRAEWKKADTYLGTALIGAISTGLVSSKHPSVIENYAYLAEASYFLKNKEKNNFYLCKTLEMDPQNTYALQFILK